MKHIFTLYFICFSFITTFGQKNRHLLYFHTSESTLNAKQTKKLDSLILSIAKNPSARVLIIGHTDSMGTFDGNKKLSLNRARTIESYFIEKGIDKKIIQKEYYAYLFPIAANNKESNRAKNRRTEIVIYTEKELADIDKAKKTQIFKFKDNLKDLEITTKGGAKIRIPAKALLGKYKNTPIENIRIEITEAYTLADILDNNLHTLSNEGVLETDGMIKLRAFDKSGELSMKKDSVFYMALPTKNKKEMDLYVMKSDTAKHWSAFELKNMINMKRYMGFYYAMNGGYADTAQTNKQLKRAFGANFNDSVTSRANYIAMAENLNYSYNIDKIKQLYGDLTYEKVNVVNKDTVNLSYRLILKDIKAMYFQNFSAKRDIAIDKLKNNNSYLIAFKYDILKNIVQYDVVDLSNTNEITLNLKTVTALEYKNNINKLWN